MITRRRLSVAAIIASCSALAVLGAATGAVASSNATTGQITACYKTSSSLPPLDHPSGKCPAGDSTLTWNKTGPRGPPGPQGPQGPQGPAGISTGISVSSTTGVALNTGVNNFVPVLSAPPAPATGTYYVNAMVMVYIGQGDGVDCILSAPGLSGVFADVAPVANSTFETLPLDQAVFLTAGQTVQVYCGDYTANGATTFYDGSMTGPLINSAIGNAAKPGLGTRHPLSPHR
jgi:hypothetical protein